MSRGGRDILPFVQRNASCCCQLSASSVGRWGTKKGGGRFLIQRFVLSLAKYLYVEKRRDGGGGGCECCNNSVEGRKAILISKYHTNLQCNIERR